MEGGDLPPPPPPARKRRAFREEKVPLNSENANKTTMDSSKLNYISTDRREERGRNSYNSYQSDRVEKSSTGNRFPNRGEVDRGGYGNHFRQRHGDGGGQGSYKGRDRLDGRQDYRTGGDKWKHDLFQDANRSPTPKDEEDQIAKVEALLAS